MLPIMLEKNMSVFHYKEIVDFVISHANIANKWLDERKFGMAITFTSHMTSSRKAFSSNCLVCFLASVGVMQVEKM